MDKRTLSTVILCSVFTLASGAAYARGSQGSEHSGGANAGGSAHASAKAHASQGKSTADLLTQNTKLSQKLGGLLPAGTDLQAAADGFKNLGQFVAAVHVSHNLGIAFDDLKAKMMEGASLGQAIHELKPAANAETEAAEAEQQAQAEVSG